METKLVKLLKTEYTTQYSTFDRYLSIDESEWAVDRIEEEHRKLEEAARQNVVTALESTGVHADNFNREEQLITSLENQARTPQGRLQATTDWQCDCDRRTKAIAKNTFTINDAD